MANCLDQSGDRRKAEGIRSRSTMPKSRNVEARRARIQTISREPFVEPALGTHAGCRGVVARTWKRTSSRASSRWRWANCFARAVEEIEKCARGCRFYAENAERFLEDEAAQTDAARSYVRYEPLGAGPRDHAVEFSVLAGHFDSPRRL